MRLVVDEDGRISGLTAQEQADRQELQRLAEDGDSVGLLQAATRATCDLPDFLGRTALMWAAVHSQRCDEALWEQLVQLRDPTCADKMGDSCLHRAAHSGNSAAASALLDSGASANARDEDKSTPLKRAASWSLSATAAVSRVLLDAGADWSLKDSQGRTALDSATLKAKSELAELLRGYAGKKFFDAPLARPPYKPGNPPFLERWDKLDRIGEGGQAKVYKVLTDTGVECAGKIFTLPKQLGDQPDSDEQKAIEKAVEGERNLCQLKHQNIVEFFYIHTELAKIVVFMELLDGKSLKNFIKDSKKPMDEENIRSFAEQICSALRYMHSRQPAVIHRDIKCSNIIVLKDGKRLKLVDFGLSIKLEQAVSHITGSTEKPKGRLCFLAPEQVGEGESEKIHYSRESDIWAFGCTVYQMASGSMPFKEARSRRELRDLIDKTKGGPPLPDGYSAVLRKFYKCCTAMDRKKRKSADELMRHEFLIGKPRGQAS